MLPAEILSRLGEMALDSGFTQTGRLDTATIKVRQEVRDACSADKCHSYGKNWSCPPACGTLEECEKHIRQYQAGLILQTTGSTSDSFDYESMVRISEEHNAHLRIFQEKLELFAPARPWLILGAGGCRNCEPCTCPRSPCPTPEKKIVSMEAMGMLVSELCAANNIPYYYGPNTLTFMGCLLLQRGTFGTPCLGAGLHHIG